MNAKTFELQLIQLNETFSKSRNNIYSDKNKESHFIELHSLFSAIKASSFIAFEEEELRTHITLLNYIFNGLEYLDNSTLNVIPFEIVSCLEKALEDWITADNFIIVTSLSNKNQEFLLESFGTNEFFNQINNYIFTKYNLRLTHRLIRIVLPKTLSRDYLSSVVLYHELGHFIDFELNISSKILLNKYGVREPINEEQAKYLNHTMEYFADIFAAQYISNSSNLFLNHIAFNNPDSFTHPATNNRILIVEEFLGGVNCEKSDEFNEVLKASGTSELKIRYKKLIKTDIDIEQLIPQTIKSKEELHYIFSLGWELWNNSERNFLKDFSSRQKYHVLNNLIEKTISNYIILESWQRVSKI